MNLHAHQYPKWLLNQPNFIHISWLFKHLFYQRIPFLKKKILKDLNENLNGDFTILDLGSGDGQFAVFAESKAKNCRIFCNDIENANLDFIDRYSKTHHFEHFNCLNSSSEKENRLFDRIWIFSVLQYVENEVEFLKNAKLRLSRSGKIFLYVPINHLKKGWLYMILFHSMNNYESMSQRKRVYNFEQLVELFDSVGLTVERHEFICSKYGIRAQEWLSNAMMFFGSKNWGVRLWGLFYFFMAVLPIILWKWADRFLPKNSQNSNAVFVELSSKLTTLN